MRINVCRDHHGLVLILDGHLAPGEHNVLRLDVILTITTHLQHRLSALARARIAAGMSFPTFNFERPEEL